jgi:hypothetical protein
MGQAGGAEVVAHLRRQVADVADRKARQQPGTRLGEDRRGAAQPVAQRARPVLPPRCLPDGARAAAHPQDRDREVVARGGSEQAVGGDRLPGQQGGPLLGRSDQQNPAAAAPPPASGLRGAQRGRDQHLCRSGAAADVRRAQLARVVADDDVQGGRSAPVGRGAERVLVQRHRMCGDDNARRQRTARRRDDHRPTAAEPGQQDTRRHTGCDDPTHGTGVQAEQYHGPGCDGAGCEPEVVRSGLGRRRVALRERGRTPL